MILTSLTTNTHIRECGALAEAPGQSRSTCVNTSMNQHSHNIEAFKNLVSESHWAFWDSAWDTHCRTRILYCTVMILKHWTNSKYIQKQWVFSLSNLFILTDKFSHSIKKYRTHHGDNLVWAPQTHMVNKLNSIQSQFGIWLLSKQTVKNYLFKTRIMWRKVNQWEISFLYHMLWC